MQPTKQPLIITERKDCKCGCHNGTRLDHESIDCLDCNGKGKSPTTLIFDDKDFMIKDRVQPDLVFKGYTLPKKGELICGNCMRKNEEHSRFYDDHNYKPFRLTSDAVLKSFADLLVETELTPKQFKEHNLSESSKIVIVEGYYE